MFSTVKKQDTPTRVNRKNHTIAMKARRVSIDSNSAFTTTSYQEPGMSQHAPQRRFSQLKADLVRKNDSIRTTKEPENIQGLIDQQRIKSIDEIPQKKRFSADKDSPITSAFSRITRPHARTTSSAKS